MNEKILNNFKEIISKYNKFEKYFFLNKEKENYNKCIPIITKEDLKEFDFEKAPEKPKIVWNTSGTTGGVSLIGISEKNYEKFLLRCDLVLEKYVEPYLKSDKRIISNMVEVFSDSYFINKNFSVLSNGRSALDNQEYDFISQRHKKIKPNIFIGTAPSIYEVLKRSNIGKDVEVIIFGGAFYGEKFLENLKKLAPNAKIIETYSFTECNFFAFRDPFKEEFYELATDSEIYLEVLTDKNEILEEGEGFLLFTDFGNFSSPFLRYKIGDRVKLVKKGKSTKLELLGRGDKLIKIGNDLVPHDEIILKIVSILSHSFFKIEFFYKSGTVKEYVIFYAKNLISEKKRDIKKYFNQEFGILVFFKEVNFDGIKISSRAKMEHIIDKRF